MICILQKKELSRQYQQPTPGRAASETRGPDPDRPAARTREAVLPDAASPGGPGPIPAHVHRCSPTSVFPWRNADNARTDFQTLRHSLSQHTGPLTTIH